MASMSVSLVQDPPVTVQVSVSLFSSYANPTSGDKHTPTRQLLIPDQVMTSQFLVISISQIGDDISLFETEAVLGWFGSIPLHKSH